jgi:transposase
MKTTTASKVNSAITMLRNGVSIREIAEKLSLGKSTIGRIRMKHFPVVECSKGGRPPLLPEADKRYCVRKVTKGRISNAVKVTKMLEEDIQIKVSPKTVRRALRAAGLGSIEKEKKPLLRDANVKKRLAWCKQHKDWTVDDWKRVIWTDETKINRFNSDGRQWAWIRAGEQLQNHHVKLTVKHGGGSIMLWSAITYAGVGWMCKIDGNMDKTLYKEILEDELEQTIAISTDKLCFRRDQVIFQQDNDPKHTSKLVTNYLQDQSYQVMQWPPQSPDLNPIENMWALLKRRLNDYETATKGMNELYERVTEVWYDQMKPEECQKVIESMPRRIQAVIKAKGKWTKY